MNAGLALMKGLTPGISALIILGFLIFAAGFVMTLISTLKAQWGHKAGEARFIISGIAVLVIGFLVIGLTSGMAC